MSKLTATRIGCDNAVGAILTEAADGAPSYGVITPLPGLMKITVNPNASSDTLFADNGPADTATTLGKIEVEIEKNALSTKEKSYLLGHQIDVNGALIYGAEDVPPWVAIGFRTLRADGSYKYVWLFKGKFVDPEETNETKKESINFQTDIIKGNFVKLSKSFLVNSKQVKPYKIEIEEDAAGVNSSVIKQWFTSVILPGASIAAPAVADTLTVVVTEGTAVGATTATITGTATASYGVGIGDVSLGTVHVGDAALTTISPYTSGADITGAVADQYLYVYDLAADGTVVKFFEKQLIIDDIKA